MLDETKLAAARLKAGTAYPFLSVAMYALSPVAQPGLGTFAVDDRWRLYIDPEKLAEWSTEEVAGVLLHEVGHVVRFHGDRAKAAFVDATTARLWNLAGDAEINDDLIRDGMHLPHPVLPRTLRLPGGRAAEFYYERLLAMSHLPDVGHVDCGEGAHGVADLSLAGPGLPAGLAADEAQLLRRKIALAVVAGRAAGLDAGGWSRWAEQFLQPTVDWRRTFGAAVRGACSAVVSGRTDYRYHRPSRRQIPQVVLPSLVRPVPSIAVVLDTSGSVTDRELSQAWGEVLGMLRGIGVRREQIRVWATDVSAHRVQWKPGEKVELIGGGGTDMSNGIDAALRDRPTPDVVVVLTDGETPWPSERPLRPVIVGLFSAEGQARPYARTPTWATVVEIPTDA